MHDLLQMGSRAAELLKARGEKVSVGETSAGGLISAALLAVPGASSYFAGGAITYSKRAIRGLAGISGSTMVVNIAGSRSAVRDGMATLCPMAAQVISELSSLWQGRLFWVAAQLQRP